jgi:hypothetical protein
VSGGGRTIPILLARSLHRLPVLLRHDPVEGWYPIGTGTLSESVAAGERTMLSPVSRGWAWVEKQAGGFSDGAQELLGKRADPTLCSGQPDWAEWTPPSQDLGATCATTNTNDGIERAEIQLVNNRGFIVEVLAPESAAYVWVDGQPELARTAVRLFTARDSVLLLPGQRMSVGFDQPKIDAFVTVPVRRSRRRARRLGGPLSGRPPIDGWPEMLGWDGPDTPQRERRAGEGPPRRHGLYQDEQSGCEQPRRLGVPDLLLVEIGAGDLRSDRRESARQLGGPPGPQLLIVRPAAQSTSPSDADESVAPGQGCRSARWRPRAATGGRHPR